MREVEELTWDEQMVLAEEKREKPPIIEWADGEIVTIEDEHFLLMRQPLKKKLDLRSKQARQIVQAAGEAALARARFLMNQESSDYKIKSLKVQTYPDPRKGRNELVFLVPVVAEFEQDTAAKGLGVTGEIGPF